jgi:hypothetical protein
MINADLKLGIPSDEEAYENILIISVTSKNLRGNYKILLGMNN